MISSTNSTLTSNLLAMKPPSETSCTHFVHSFPRTPSLRAFLPKRIFGADKRFLLVGLALTLLAACTPADEQYCQSFGVVGTSEFGKCMAYYHEQNALFGADRAQCAFEADATYPPTLYDYGHTEEVMGGFSRGVYYGGTTVFVQPDMRHNMQVDQLRMRIIEPCMHARGWNSGQTWQAGRHAVAKMKPALRSQFAPVAAPLPWLQ